MGKKVIENKIEEEKIVVENKATTPKKKTNKKEEIVEEVAKDTTPKVVEETEEKIDKPKKSKKRKVIVFIILLILIILLVLGYFFFIKDNEKKEKKVVPKVNEKLAKLPKPELAEGERGQLGIDKNVNEKTIDKYLNRDDSVYRDMRMLEDPAKYESIGGDSYLSGYIKGFEIVPLPYIIPVSNLPEEVGETYQGSTLFFELSDGTYAPNYKESMDIVEKYFPKDKIIFLMCGGGGYAGMMKNFLVSQGWNEDYIYVVGGHWYYKGKNNIKVPKSINRWGKPVYDFSDVPYHEIDFTELTEVVADRHNTGDIEPFYLEDEYYNSKDEAYDKLVNDYESSYDDYNKTHEKYVYEEYIKFYNERAKKVADYINSLMKSKKNFALTVYNDTGCDDDDDTIRIKSMKFFEDNNIYAYDIPYEVFSKTDTYKDVKNAPTTIIFKKGKVYTFYYDESDEDLKYNESDEAAANWLKKYILLKEQEISEN